MKMWSLCFKKENSTSTNNNAHKKEHTNNCFLIYFILDLTTQYFKMSQNTPLIYAAFLKAAE